MFTGAKEWSKPKTTTMKSTKKCAKVKREHEKSVT